jgi:hypothetical protein
MYDHGIETYLVDFPKEPSDRYFFIHDYMKVDFEDQQLCAEAESDNSSSTQTKIRMELGRQAGILEIVEAENCESIIDGTIEQRIRNVVIRFGMNPVNVATSGRTSHDDDMIEPRIVIMEEGYVIARCWPDRLYCAMDLHLWGAYHKRARLVTALTEELRSTLVSSYRIVTGGMYETKTWEDDQKQIGVQFSHNQNCRESLSLSNRASSPTVAELWSDSLKTLVAMAAAKDSRTLVVAVACGVAAEGNCWALEWMAKHPLVSDVIGVFMCPTVDPSVSSTVGLLESMHKCEREIISQLRHISVEGGKSIDIVVLDDSVDEALGRILNSILSEQSHRETYLSDNYAMVVPTFDLNQTTKWRTLFLERYRTLVRNSVVLSLAELHMVTLPTSVTHVMGRDDTTIKDGDYDDGILLLGMVYCCDELAIPLFTELELSLRTLHPSTVVEIVYILGGELQHPRDIVSYEQRTFPMDAYDLTAHGKQMTSQEALGRQSVVQLEPAGEADVEGSHNNWAMPLFDELYQYLESTVVTTMGFGPVWKSEKYHGPDQLGALGGIVTMSYPQGNVVLVWDGKEHVDINLFSYNQNKELPDQFIHSFCSLVGLEVKLRDDQPRGVGRVVSFGTAA